MSGASVEAEETANAKVLGQKHVWCVEGSPGGQYGKRRMIKARNRRVNQRGYRGTRPSRTIVRTQ